MRNPAILVLCAIRQYLYNRFEQIVIAEHNQIECIGALGLLLVAKRRGKISMLAPYVSKLRQSSIFYGDDLLDQVLKLAGE